VVAAGGAGLYGTRDAVGRLLLTASHRIVVRCLWGRFSSKQGLAGLFATGLSAGSTKAAEAQRRDAVGSRVRLTISLLDFKDRSCKVRSTQFWWGGQTEIVIGLS